MAKQSNQKAKLLYLQKFLTEETDAQHGITIAGLVDRLAEAGIAAERKSLYDDIEVLRAFGLQIETVRGRANSYKLTGRVLQAQEVVKTCLALKAAGVEGAEAIIESLCGLLSKYDAESVKNELAAAVMPQQDNAHSTEAQEAQETPAEILSETVPEAAQAECVKETAQPETDEAEEKSAPEAEKTAAAKDAGDAETIELKCAAELQDGVLAYLGAGAKIVKVKSSGVVIKAKTVINEDFYAQLIKWGGVKLSEPSERRKEFKKYCKKIISQYK